MSASNLNPRDRVIELAGVVVSSSVITGAIASPWIVWLIKKSWLTSSAALFAGAVLGFSVGQSIIRMLRYRTADGDTTIVKVGKASLPMTIPAGLVGGMGSAIFVFFLALILFGATSQVFLLLGIAVGCGIAIGALVACISSLT